MPTSLIATVRFICIYPLRQFAPVIHENHRVRAASQWAPVQKLPDILARLAYTYFLHGFYPIDDYWAGEDNSLNQSDMMFLNA